MKSIFLALSFFSFSVFSTETYEVKSTIKNVVVYQQGAQIKRQGTYTVQKGITELVIRGVSPTINPATLQINATGTVVILDSKHTIFYPEPDDNRLTNELPPKIKREITLLEDSLFDLSYELATVQNKIDVLNSQKRIIENNGTIKGVGKVNDSIPLLRDALAFYIKEMNTINAGLLDLNRAHVKLTRKKTRMNTRLNELMNYNANIQQNQPVTNSGPIHELKITVSAEEATTGRLVVTYLVNNAGWIPLYDLRSSNSAGTIELTYKAQVYQNTGIDWETTPLSLSTNNPYANKTKPTMNPWYLDYYTAQNNYNQSDSRKDLEASTRYAGASQPGSLYDAEEATEAPAITADQFVTTIEQLLSVEYAIDLPYTIKSDNQPNMVLVKNTSLKTEYIYYTVPKLDASVYLIAQITNLAALNLLPGKATIFHDGSYLGNTYINPSAMSDTMDLSLGKTSNINVTRILLKNASKEKVVGDKIVKTFAYSITVKNLSKSTLDLIVEDQLPISRNPEIEIEIENISKAKHTEVNGFLTWKDKLKPNGINDYDIVFNIKYDKTKPINLAYN